MPKCAKCNYIIKKDFLTCNSCNKTYHPGCARSCLGSKSDRGCCQASLSNSHQRSRLTTMTQPIYNTASGVPSDPQNPLFSFSNELTLPQQLLQTAADLVASVPIVPILLQQHQQAATITVSVFSVPQQHSHAAATVSDEMSRFNNLYIV